MAPNRGLSQVPTLVSIGSLFWISNVVQKHSLLEQPRLSAFLVLALSGLISLGVSYSSRWLPLLGGGHSRSRSVGERKASGRDEARSRAVSSQKDSHFGLPKRPQSYFMPLLIGCIVLRVEVFSRVNYDLQCSRPGIEYFLPLVLCFYELLPGRTDLLTLQPEPEKEDDMYMTAFDDLFVWLSSSRAVLRLGVILLTWGAWQTAVFDAHSTFYCASADWSTYVLLLQWLGVALDATIIIVSWRLLSWVRVTKSKLRTLGTVLLMSSAGTLAFVLVAAIFGRIASSDPPGVVVRNAGSVFIKDIIADGVAVAIFIISSTLSLCDSDPVTLTSIFVFLLGIAAALPQFIQIDEFTQASQEGTALWTVYLLCFGFTIFLFLNQTRSIGLITKLTILFFITTCVISVAAILYMAEMDWPAHRLEYLIYDARTIQKRWELSAGTSETLRCAVGEYREGNFGRDPPLGFDAWFEFAMERNSLVIDQYGQITKDMWPFWGLDPAEIRRSVDAMAAEPDIGMVTIKNGAVSHGEVADDAQKEIVGGLVELIQPFVQHLPDMQLPINLAEMPRVLTPWTRLHQLKQAGRPSGSAPPSRRSFQEQIQDVKSQALQLAREAKLVNRAEPQTPKARDTSPPISASTFRLMTALTCPPGSAARSGSYWNNRDLNAVFTRGHSKAQFLWYRGESDDICNQPDLLNLHEFFLIPPTHRPIQYLLPVFSRSKTDNFNDILIPLPRPSAETTTLVDPGLAYDVKLDRMFWRGTLGASYVGHQVLRGGQQARLAHLVNNASASDTTTLLTPRTNGPWAYERVPTRDINAALPFDLGVGIFDCASLPTACATAARELGGLSGRDSSNEPHAALASRYVAVLDTARGPPRELKQVLNSTSLPFVSSIFQEWYTERLMPWQHYVPIDLRFHALHSTLAYFTGLIGRGWLGGKPREMKAAQSDARWIAEEGKRWVGKVVRREDEEVYLFRVLLEWGRVISEGREGMGFRLEEGESG